MSLKTIEDVKEVNATYNPIQEIFNITKDSGKNIVEGLTITGSGGTVLYTPGTDSDKPKFTIENGTGTLATIEISTDFGATITNNTTVNVPGETEGHILVKVISGDYKKVITINVNTKK